ncbi:MAG: thiamine diphosphokinase [Candidatus Marinimicrobia bacterium]|nr:thiamine diphosphokinase [Candidatus Neomarinimicrobiota bacterium]
MDSSIILANGQFPTHPIPLQILNEATTIICCDGAVNNLVEYGLKPTYIIGDMDSISPELKIKYEDRLIHVPNQKENDLRKAINWAEKNNFAKAHILGASGKRDDHNLANIFTILEYHSKLEMTFYTDYGKFSVGKGEQIFDSFTGEQISLFSTDKTIIITSTHLKYILINKKLTNLYCGSLNESINDFFTISISHGKILVYQAFK